MIDQIRIQNFKCIQDATLDLCPLTVLIGPNDSGKTSILWSIRCLAQNVVWVGPPQFPLRVYRRELKRKIQWHFAGTHAGKSFDFDAECTNTREACFLNATGAALEGNVLETSPIFKFEPPKLRLPSVPRDVTLSETGDNLAAVLDAMMTGDDRDGFLELEQTLRRECPTLKGITLRTQVNGQNVAEKAIEFLLAGEGKVRIPASEVSDGVMLLTAYLALAYSNTPDLILLEEPENGLHPSRLEMIMTLLRKITTGEIGNRPRQILLTTHSPLLLNFCRKEEVRIVRRNAEGDTTIAKMEQAPNIDKLLHEFAIGELWYLLGEEGILKGERP